MIKVLMVSTDKKILEEGSSVRTRMQFLGQVFDELHIVVLGAKGINQKYANITLYPMSRFRAFFFKAPVVHVVSSQDPFETGIIASRIATRVNAKLGFQIHTDFLSPYFKKSSLVNRVRVLIAKNIIHCGDGIRVVSQKIKDSIVERLRIEPNLISVLPVYIDSSKIDNAIITVNLRKKYPQFKKIILIASRITKEKDIPTALRAFKKTLESFPDTGLVIVGEGPELISIKNLVNVYKLENSVVLEPWSKDLSSYYKTADIFLNTSLYEGYGMTIVEARIAKIPVVSTDVGIARDILPPELISEVGDSESISRGLNLILSGVTVSFKIPKLLSKSEYLTEYSKTFLI